MSKIDKSLTVGVEIEMTGLARAHAADIVATELGGQVGRMARNCYETREITAPDGRVWKVMRDASITREAGGDPLTWENAVELVTPILHYEDIETLQHIVRALRKAGAKVNDSCGIHVHVGAGKFDARHLRNLVNIINSKEDLIYDAMGVLRNREDRYCKKIYPEFLMEVNAPSQPLGSREDIIDTWYESQGESWNRNDHYNDTRYHGLNLHAVDTKGTVEFRVFNSTLHAGKVKAYIQFCMAVVSQALAQKSASPTKTTTTNPKYTFRTWLLRLGLIGEEYATCRKWMLEKLEGDSAFRDARRLQRA